MALNYGLCNRVRRAGSICIQIRIIVNRVGKGRGGYPYRIYVWGGELPLHKRKRSIHIFLVQGYTKFAFRANINFVAKTIFMYATQKNQLRRLNKQEFDALVALTRSRCESF